MVSSFKNLLHFLYTLKPTRIRKTGIKAIAASAFLLVLISAMARPAAAAGGDIAVFYNGLQKQFSPGPQIVNDRVLVPMKDIFEALGAEMTWNPESRTAMAYKDGKYISVQVGSLVGIKADAQRDGDKYRLSNSQHVKLDAAPIIANRHTMVPMSFVSQSLGADVQWFGNTRQIFIKSGTATTPPAGAAAEMRGVWLSYNDLANFNSSAIDSMLDKAAAMKLNTVFVHARAFSDAFYKSELFPWSHKLTGVQGQAPAVDPLQYIIDAGHKRGLRIEAWINPYRISNSTELTNSMAPNNPAVQWLNDPAKVIHYQANDEECLIYNPASQEVRNLITAGVLEIVNHYEVDGIHFDDYFYVTGTGENYDEEFKKTQVNKLVQQVYAAVKAAKPSVSFGISPAGNIANCLAAGADVETWLSRDGYVDYVCPQIYWTNEYTNAHYQFDNCLNDWLAMKQNPHVKMYVGLALYRVGASSRSDPGWADRQDNLLTQVQHLRGTGQCSGFILFDISNLLDDQAQNELANLRAVL